MTDREIDLFVEAFLAPPPYGFTGQERKQILDWLKRPYPVWLELPKRQKISYQFFQYETPLN